jgi:opacity protein-like surface antigen
MKRFLCFVLPLLCFAPIASAQYYFDYPKYSRLEASAFAFGWQSLENGQTTYMDSWRDRLLLGVIERTLISSKPSPGAGAGVSFAFYFNRNLGIEMLMEASASEVKTEAEMFASWTWADNRLIRQTASWPGTGRFSSARISLNVAGRIPGLRRDWTASAGLTAFRNVFSSDSWFGFGISKLSEDGQNQLIDIFKIGLRVPQTTWWALGLDLGLGVKHKLSDRIGLKAEVRAFFCPAKTVSWSFVQGIYDGVFYGQLLGEPFGQDSVDIVTGAGTLSPFTVKPSSLRIGLGLSWASVSVVEY